MKKILCPIDFSKAAMNALEYAFEIAKKFKSELILFHAMHPAPVLTVNSPLDLDKPDHDTSRAKLEKICRDMASKNFHGINYMFIVKTGFAEDKILDLVNEHNIDMIITGTKGAEGIRTLFGTLSADLAVKSSCPVLVVPEHYKFDEIKKIIYASDLSASGIEKNMEHTRKLAKAYDAHVTFLTIERESPESEDVEYLTERGLGMVYKNKKKRGMDYYMLSNENVAQGINLFAEEKNANLIIISSHKRNFAQRLFSKSVTKEVTFHSGIPVLVLHD
ncbi:MAG: universal stress protein [Cytophagaceae bacterium]|nr:universal stress protein [Cytophagaceae bacterium]